MPVYIPTSTTAITLEDYKHSSTITRNNKFRLKCEPPSRNGGDANVRIFRVKIGRGRVQQKKHNGKRGLEHKELKCSNAGKSHYIQGDDD